MKQAFEYPSLYAAASSASSAAQRVFLRLNAAQLSVLVLTAFVSGWTPASAAGQRGVAICVAVLMLGALAVSTSLRIWKFDDRWFRCRALAENVKSAVWYFVMCPAAQVSGSRTAYLEQIKQLQERLEQVAKEVASHDTDGPLVTRWMEESQNLSVDEKVSIYRRERLEDQRHWYHTKSQQNAKHEKLWAAAIFVIEFLAVGYAALQAWRLWEFNAVGTIAALSAALIAWMQTKRFSDLALSYSIAAGDLRHIASQRERAATEAEAQQLVKEVEAAVSREHSMWFARRAP